MADGRRFGLSLYFNLFLFFLLRIYVDYIFGKIQKYKSIRDFYYVFPQFRLLSHRNWHIIFTLFLCQNFIHTR